MRDCKECEFFDGYDYSDGTPYCTCEGGYECCPFNDMSNVKKKGMSIEIDAGFMHDYILHTMKNTIESEAYEVARDEIKSLVTDEIKTKVLNEMSIQIHSVVSDAISDFMGKEITVGGGWSEPERTLTRTQYLAEAVEKELKNMFKSEPIKSYATKQVKDAINTYERKLRDDINISIKNHFDAATRQVLTENVVSMLMCNDTYKKLSDSMQTFLPKNEC